MFPVLMKEERQVSGNFDWSASEKKIARKAYDQALEKRLSAFVADFKRRAAAVSAASEIWDIDRYIREEGKDIDMVFDYRYSQLIIVFARIIQDGLLNEGDLAGLDQDKLDAIRSAVAVIARLEQAV